MSKSLSIFSVISDFQASAVLIDETSVSSGQKSEYRIALLIPAHNERESIEQPLRAALKQTANNLDVQFDIFVIADNCTDGTEEVVLRTVRAETGQEEDLRVTLIKTENNKNKKSGALNQAYERIREAGYTYIASADADTIWDAHFLENGLKEMEKRGEKLGGICGRVGLLPFKKRPFQFPDERGKFFLIMFLCWVIQFYWRGTRWVLCTLWEYIWWSFQNVEYSIGQSVTVGRYGQAHCLAGPGTIYRAATLEEVYQKYGQVWPNSLTEDFELTVRIQMLGYETGVGHDMFVYTDCPIGFKAHSIQRERWNGGNLSTYMSIGLNRHTLWGGIDLGWQLIWFVCRINLIITAVQIWITGFVYIDRLGYILLLSPIFITVLLHLFRYKYVAYKSLFQFLIGVCLGYEIYALWYGIVLTQSYIKAFTNKVNRWR
jgi:cellulose synthase/poly-beta-1,6-N-acetylglucosamine synthase-like glycosyltransferase